MILSFASKRTAIYLKLVAFAGNIGVSHGPQNGCGFLLDSLPQPTREHNRGKKPGRWLKRTWEDVTGSLTLGKFHETMSLDTFFLSF